MKIGFDWPSVFRGEDVQSTDGHIDGLCPGA